MDLSHQMPQYERKDRFYQKAKKEGYPARSAYKLIELDQRFKILKPGGKIVDLGSAPGGWLKVAEELVNGGWCMVNGKKAEPNKSSTIHHSLSTCIIGIDLLPLQYTPGPGVFFIQGDFLDPANQKKILQALGGYADWVLSDMSPNISGIKFRDTLASAELCEVALEFAKKVLKKGGGLVVKIFPGPELDPFRKKAREVFEKVLLVTPEATRKSSNEVYLVATGRKFL